MTLFVTTHKKDYRETLWYHHTGMIKNNLQRGCGDGNQEDGTGGIGYYADEQMTDITNNWDLRGDWL